MYKKCIGVIGANGFVGKYLSNKLKKNNINYEKISIRGLNLKINNINISLDSKNFFKNRFHTIIDCSNPNEENNNFISYKKEANSLLEIIKQSGFNGKYILLSSVSVYSNNIKYVNNNTSLNPWNEYGESKVKKEIFISDYQKKMGKIFHIIRPSGILGLSMHGTFIRRITDNALSNKDIFIFGKKSYFNNIVGVDNLVRIILKLLEIDENKKIVLGSKSPLTLFQIANLILESTNSTSKIIIKEMGREPFIIDDDCWLGFEEYIQTTKTCLEVFLSNYINCYDKG